MTNAEKLAEDITFMTNAVSNYCDEMPSCKLCEYLVRDEDGEIICLFNKIDPNKDVEENIRNWLEQEYLNRE